MDGGTILLRLVEQLERVELHFVTQKDRAEDLQDELDRVNPNPRREP